MNVINGGMSGIGIQHGMVVHWLVIKLVTERLCVPLVIRVLL